MSPSKFREKTRKEAHTKTFGSVQKLQAKTERGKYILSHVFEFILKSYFSHALLNTYVSCSAKPGERTWQSLTCHIENVFEHEQAFSLQIKGRKNQRKMIQKKNSALIRKKRMRIKGNQKKSRTFQKTWLRDHRWLRYEKEAMFC